MRNTVFSSVFWIYLCLVSIVCILTYGQLAINYLKVPHDRHYYGGEEYPLDFSQNIAHIRQGYEGHWMTFFNNTTLFSIRPSLLKFEYILVGKFARLFSLDPIVGYVIVRGVVSLLWFAFLYALVFALFKRPLYQVLAFFFILFGAGVDLGGDSSFVSKAVFDAQPAFRFTYQMLHYLLGGLLAMVSMALFSHAFVAKQSWKMLFVFSALIGAWASLVYGPNAILILGSLCFFVIYRGLFFRHELKKTILLTSIYGIILALPLLYVRFVVAVQLEAYRLNTHMERLNPFRVSPREYLLSVGGIYALSLLSVFRLRRRHPFFSVLYGWIAMHPLGVFVLSDLLDLNQIRFFLTPYAVVFGLLGALGIETMSRCMLPRWDAIRRYAIGAIALGICFSSIVSFYRSWKTFDLCFCLSEDFSIGYPTKDTVQAMWWLRDHTNNSDIVFSDLYAGALIPAFAGNIVYTSWWFRLTDLPIFYQSYSNVIAFFRGDFSDDQARSFLRSNNISFVFYGIQERNHSPWRGEPGYASLQEVARFGNVVVYRVAL